MAYFDTPHCLDEEDGFGDLAFHVDFPSAVRSLEDGELQILLLVLLQEWRRRAQTQERFALT